MQNLTNNIEQLDPVMIITRLLSDVPSHLNPNNSNELMANIIDQLTSIHCPKNIAPESQSAIDKIKLKFEYKTNEQKAEINTFLSTWLSQHGISISSKQANLTHFTHGTKLYSKDEANILCGSLKSHADKQKIQLEITGGGCNYVNANKMKFSSLYAICKHLGGIITYLDIAVDDFSGKFNIKDTKEKHKGGRYDPPTGKRPNIYFHSSPTGDTVYIGAYSSYRRVKVYEKGKESGYPVGSDEYVKHNRHEVTLEGRKHHVIELDALLTPDRDFVTAYPKAHKRILRGVKPRCVFKETSRTKINSFSKSLAFNKHQWGKSNNALAQLVGNKEEAIELISRKGMPDKMKLPHYIDMEVIKAITESESGLSIAQVIEQQMALHAPNCKGSV